METEPEKESLLFDLPSDSTWPDIAEARLAIKQVAEKLLYHWKSFPIVLPPSITDDLDGDSDSFEHISFKNLFVAPTFDEVEQVAHDSKGNIRRLSEKQLKSIRQTGEFEVESMNFPGQVHRWKLAQFLQKGTQHIYETLLNDMALALRILLIHARNRFSSPFFSMSEGLRSIGRSCWQLLDILIGMQSSSTAHLETKLQEEHSRFLVAELNVRPEAKRDWKSFCNFIKDKCSQLEVESIKTLNLTPPPVPYCFQTPTGSDIDLRLFNKALMNQCNEILKKILDQESKGWYIKYKDRLITELKGQNMSYAEIKDYVNKSIQQKYVQKVFDAVLASEEIEALQPRLGALIVEQAKSALNMEKALVELKAKLFHHQQEHESLLIKRYPVRSRIPQWLNERLEEFRSDFISQNQWSAHTQVIDECKQQHLEQTVYFLHRDLIFMRDREHVLKKELSRVKKPNRVFRFSCCIWFPHRWVVKRHLYGEVEVIPTIVSESSISRTAEQRPPNPDEPSYTVEKTIVHKTSTRVPFWRWINYCYRTLTWTWNTMYFLGMVIPYCSPLSFRALFCPSPYMANLKLNPVNGTLCPDPKSRVKTLVFRLEDLWSHVRRARRDFENEPETGFLGRSFTRHFNRFWNYGIKGALGSFLLVTIFVPLCLLVSSVSLLAAFAAPLWMPVVTLFCHLCAVLFYDFDHPSNRVCHRLFYVFETLFFRFLIAGCFQPIAAVVTAVVILPLTAFVLFSAGLIRRCFRAVWDAFMFHTVIKKRGRVPSRDGFTVRRIAGPGLASNYYYQVRPEQALAAAEAHMELHELNAWKERCVQVIEQPKDVFRRFVEQCFGPFSASLSEDGVYRALVRECKQYLQLLMHAVDTRKQKLNTGLNHDLQCRIRLTSRELKVVIAQTSKMLEDFYPEHVIQRLMKREEDFWEDRHLEQGDWQGLATQLLTEVFSSSFLTPLEETDTCFKLQVHHLNLLRYLEMLKSAEFRDDLDVVSTVHTPKGDIDVDQPFLDPQIFSPQKESVTLPPDGLFSTGGGLGCHRWVRRWPWRRHRHQSTVPFEKLVSLLPIAHPAIIAVLIHNRDVDRDPINLDELVCRQIVQAAENLEFVDVNGPSGFDPYDPDGDASTPDHTTSNSDPDVVQVHLAEQEQISETNFGMSFEGLGHPGGMPSREPTAPESNDDDDYGDGHQVEPKVVYLETPTDNSCVTNSEDETGDQFIEVKVEGSGEAGSAATCSRVDVQFDTFAKTGTL